MRRLALLAIATALCVLLFFLLQVEPQERAGKRQDTHRPNPQAEKALGPPAPNRPPRLGKGAHQAPAEKKKGSLAVLVLDPSGSPLEGARVSLLPDSLFLPTDNETFQVEVSPAPTDPLQGRTDARGRITFAGLAPGSWKVIARKEGYARSTATVVLKAGREIHTELRLSKGWPLAGVVVNSRGEPVPGAQVLVRLDQRVISRQETDSEGRFRTECLAEGKYWVSATGGPPEERSRVKEPVKIPLEEEIRLVLPFPYARVIMLKVLDSRTRKVIEEARVRVGPIGGLQGSPRYKCSRRGDLFEVRLSKNVTDITCRVEAPDYVSQELSFKINRKKSEPIYREVLLERAAYIVPILLDWKGNEIDKRAQKATFSCSYRQGSKLVTVSSMPAAENIAVPPQTDCEVVLDSLRMRDLRSKCPKAVIRSGLPGEETPCVIRMPWLGEIICKVACPEQDAEGIVYLSLGKVEEKENGAPQVRAYSEHNVKCGDTTWFWPLSAGRYIVRVDPYRLVKRPDDCWLCGQALNCREVILTEGSDPVEVTLRLEDVVKTAIRVLDGRGRLVHAKLFVRFGDFSGFRSLLGSSFSLFSKTGEKLVLRAFDIHLLEGVSDLLEIERGGGRYDLVLRPFFAVPLKVLNAEGEEIPPEDYAVEVSDTQGKLPWFHTYVESWTPDGQLYLRRRASRNVLISDPGTYELRITAENYKPQVVEVEVQPGEIREVEVILQARR